MAIITPNEGEKLMLAAALGLASAGGYTCKLFKSNTTPTATTVHSDLTICDFSGYASVGVSWTTPVTTSGRGESTGSICTFTRDGTDPGTDNTAYGWLISAPNSLESSAETIIAIERFSSPESFATLYRQLVITPKMNLFSEF